MVKKLTPARAAVGIAAWLGIISMGFYVFNDHSSLDSPKTASTGTTHSTPNPGRTNSTTAGTPLFIRLRATTYLQSAQPYAQFDYCLGYTGALPPTLSVLPSVDLAFANLGPALSPIIPVLMAKSAAAHRDAGTQPAASDKAAMTSGEHDAEADFQVIRQTTEANQTDAFGEAVNAMKADLLACVDLTHND